VVLASEDVRHAAAVDVPLDNNSGRDVESDPGAENRRLALLRIGMADAGPADADNCGCAPVLRLRGVWCAQAQNAADTDESCPQGFQRARHVSRCANR